MYYGEFENRELSFSTTIEAEKRDPGDEVAD